MIPPRLVTGAALAVGIFAGCASRQPPPELVEARTAYARAQSGTSVQWNPAGLYEGKRALDVAERKQEDDPGSVVFETARAELLPSARTRLNEVAEALKNVEGRHISVVGYTDDRGSDTLNMDLSKRRADAVRVYLVSRGVRDDMISSEGRGKN